MRITLPLLLGGLAAFVSVGSTGCKDTPYCIANCGDGGIIADAEILDVPSADAKDLTTDARDVGPQDLGNDLRANDACNLPDGSSFDTDPNNCGQCGNVCNLGPHTFANCVGGQCVFDKCEDGYHDVDPNDPGCEYFCIPTDDPTEICDQKDNDCDGIVDNGFDTESDPNNCGICGNVCNLGAHTLTHECNMGICRSAANGCEPGWVDLSPDRTAGCTYECTPTNGGVEICDGIDNDCNGLIDDGVVTGGSCCPWLAPDPNDPSAATTPCPAQVLGECRAGEVRCLGGATICFGAQGPTPEFCDTKDNDCDGVTDPMTQNDVNNCGGCGIQCAARQNADATCVNGTCTYACRTTTFRNQFNEDSNRFVDVNGDLNAPQGMPSNGCECVKSLEVCDGNDNDCDGVVDGTKHCSGGVCNGSVGPPVASGLTCVTLGECAGMAPTCVGGRFICDYRTFAQNNGRTIDTDASGNLAPVETKCDGKDNNCDGVVDNSPLFATARVGGSGNGTQCGVGRGACQTTGKFACSMAQDGVDCCDTFTQSNGSFICSHVAVEDLTKSRPETCNNKDDDCDGVIDNPGQVHDEMVRVTRANGTTFFIDKFEASRPDAVDCTGLSTAQCLAQNGNKGAGVVETERACSNDRRIPWDNATFDEALAACTSSQKRLCTQAEWEEACQGGHGGTAGPFTFPYGNTYGAGSCNGHDFDGVQDALVATGSIAACNSPYQARDMSGNLREWTSTNVIETRQCTANANCQGALAGSSYRATSTCNVGAQLCQCASNADCTAPSTCQGNRCTLCQGGECVFKIRGGGFNNISTGLACTFDFEFDFQNVALPIYGFRCCRDTAPP